MADKNELKEIIVKILKDEDTTIDNIKDDTILIGKDGKFFDSIDVLELIVELEKKFGIKIKDSHLIQEKFKTFETCYKFIEENEK